jgi:hypothetical protein
MVPEGLGRTLVRESLAQGDDEHEQQEEGADSEHHAT